MSADLVRLWAERDAAHEAWRQFVAEADAFGTGEDPVLQALNVFAGRRTPEQEDALQEFQERRQALLEGIWEAERRVRVASGHGTLRDLKDREGSG